jgi:hypothetical protein
MNRGRWRYPLFGNRKFWYVRRVQPDWFDRPTRKAEVLIRGRVLDTLRRYLRKLEG